MGKQRRYFVSEKKNHFKVALIPKREPSKEALKIYRGLGHQGRIVRAVSQSKAIANFARRKK
jgi:hypothetical protein